MLRKNLYFIKYILDQARGSPSSLDPNALLLHKMNTPPPLSLAAINHLTADFLGWQND